MDEGIKIDDLQVESDRMVARFTTAIKNFRDAHASYGESGEALESEVCKLLANYYDPANRRALLIQRTAQELSEEIRHFEGTVRDVDSHYVSAHSAVKVAAVNSLAKTVDNYRIVLPATRAGGGKDLTASVLEAMAGLSDAQKRNALLRAQGIVVGERMATASQVAAGLLRLREAELRSYLGQAPPAEALSIRQALIEAVAADGGWTAAEYLLTEVGKVIGTAIPITNIVIHIATVALDLRSKIRSLQSRYEPGDVDLMLDLSEEMSIERRAMKDAVTLFDEVFSLSRKELELKPEFRA